MIKWQKPNSEGLVSEVDLMIDKLLRDRLLSARPNYGFLSEESKHTNNRLESSHIFIVDPIDGTQEYLNGGNDFSISIALIIDNLPSCAVVYVPVKNLLYVAEKGKGSWCNGKALISSNCKNISKAEGLVSLRELEAPFWQEPLKIKANSIPSIAYRFCKVAAGDFDCMVSLKPINEWDSAAGELIAHEAGLKITDLNGRSNIYNQEDPRFLGNIVANEYLHREILRKSILYNSI